MISSSDIASTASLSSSTWRHLESFARGVDAGEPTRWKGATVDLGTGGVLDPKTWRALVLARPCPEGIRLELRSGAPDGPIREVLVPGDTPHMAVVRGVAVMGEHVPELMQVARGELFLVPRGIWDRRRSMGDVYFARRDGIERPPEVAGDPDDHLGAMLAVGALEKRLAGAPQTPVALRAGEMLVTARAYVREVIADLREEGLGDDDEFLTGFLETIGGAYGPVFALEALIADERAKRPVLARDKHRTVKHRRAVDAGAAARATAANRRGDYVRQEAVAIVEKCGSRSREALGVDVIESWTSEEFEKPSLSTVLRLLSGLSDEELKLPPRPRS